MRLLPSLNPGVRGQDLSRGTVVLWLALTRGKFMHIRGGEMRRSEECADQGNEMASEEIDGAGVIYVLWK